MSAFDASTEQDSVSLSDKIASKGEASTTQQMSEQSREISTDLPCGSPPRLPHSAPAPKPDADGAVHEIAQAAPGKLDPSESERTSLPNVPLVSLSEADAVPSPSSLFSFISWVHYEDACGDWQGPIPPGRVMHKDLEKALATMLATISSEPKGLVNRVAVRRKLM